MYCGLKIKLILSYLILRYNLDPAGEISDDKMWTALESVQLKETIEALPDKLGMLQLTRKKDYLSRVMRKPAFCICENKDADQLRGNREADQRLCFRYTDTTIPQLSKSEISSL